MPDSTGPTQGVPPSGNGGLIAMGVILLLAAGGLVFWKSSNENDQPEEIIEEAPQAKTTEKKEEPEVFENAPPPPPDEEEEEEEKPVVATGKTGGTAKPTGPPGCNNACAGTATPALQSALGARGAMARSCYMTALRNNPSLKGKMTVSVKVSPTGAVCSAYVSNNSLGDQAVAACATAKFRAGKFPAPTGGCVNVNVPLNFTSKQ